MIEVEKVSLPAFLASALVNGDESGLSEDAVADLARAYAWLGDWRVVDVEGEVFYGRWNGKLCEMVTYVCHVEAKS